MGGKKSVVSPLDVAMSIGPTGDSARRRAGTSALL
jgi:hypothetical protein